MRVLISPGKITLGDLKRCRMAHIFFDTFFNLEKYLDHEQRDPFAVQKVGIYISILIRHIAGGVNLEGKREKTQSTQLKTFFFLPWLIYEKYGEDDCNITLHVVPSSNTILQ